jgi:hypothetical protein
MIKSEFIKWLCCVIFILAIVMAIVAIIVGLSLINDKINYGWFIVVVGVISPLITAVSLFPVVALAKIEINVSKMKEEMEEININFQKLLASKKVNSSVNTESDCDKNETNLQHVNDDYFKKAIDFFNSRYNTHINYDDEIQVIKDIILSIDCSTTSYAILKSKIEKAKSFFEVKNAIIMHKVVNDNNT